MDYDEPHLMLNEKTQPIEWIEQPTSALVHYGPSPLLFFNSKMVFSTVIGW